MDKKKQNLFLSVMLVCLVLSLIPQVYGLWQTIQLPFDQLFSQPGFWYQLGLLLLIPSLFVLVTLSLPQLDIEERDVYQKPLVLNFVVAGLLQLIAAWRAYQAGGMQVGFYLILAIFSFSTPALIKQIRTRFST